MTIVFVHGGVAGVKREVPSLHAAIAEASTRADRLDAVEAAVRVLEDRPDLNAGYGSVLNRDGAIELDAGIADGPAGHGAGVACVTVRHPVSLARLVLEQTPHGLLVGAGAMTLAGEMDRLDRSSPEQHERWAVARREGRLALRHFGSPEHVDTVGAVALDDDGNLAAASSTGGVFGKLPGRVGDAPIFGAGVFSDRRVAVVGTGVGELFLTNLAAFQVASLVHGGTDPQSACEKVVARLGEGSDAPAGLLALDDGGSVGAAFRGGSWAVEGPRGPVPAVQLP